ncbi:MAG: hypothetical protein WCJ19_00915 [bacterium]
MPQQPTNLKGYLTQIENFLSTYFLDKTPALPKEWKEVIVQYSPWIMVIALILSIPFIFLGVIFSIFGAALSFVNILNTYQILINLVFGLPTMILYCIAIPGLLKRSKGKGWNFVFIATLIAIVFNVLSLSIFGIVGNALSLYILFQIREYYN